MSGIDSILEPMGEEDIASMERWNEREKEVDDLRSKLEFYQRRCEALQGWQSRMRDPERTVVCDILANGCTLTEEAAGDRYKLPPDDSVALRAKLKAMEEEMATLEKYRRHCSSAVRSLLSERHRQDERWGEQRHGGERWVTILSEEVGEVARAVLERGLGDSARQELVQVAAVAIAVIEHIDSMTREMSSVEASPPMTRG